MGSITQAMVLAAGLGTRMRPITNTMPKPLVPVLGKPLVDYALDQLVAHGITRVVVNTSYLADMLEAHLKKRSDIEILISRESQPLETGGGIKHALPLLSDAPLVCMNSDTICLNGNKDSALDRLVSHWNADTLDILMLVVPVEKSVGYNGKGDFFVDTEGRIRRRQPEESAPYIFTGIQILNPKIFLHSPDGAFSMNVLYNQRIGADGTLQRTKAVAHDGMWLHIGDPEGLTKSEAFLSSAQIP